MHATRMNNPAQMKVNTAISTKLLKGTYGEGGKQAN